MSRRGSEHRPRLLVGVALSAALAHAASCARPSGGDAAAPPPPLARAVALQIGLIPEQNIFAQIERYQPLADYLSRRTGSAIRLTVLPRYGNIIDNFVSSGLDGAFFGSFTYALAHSRLGVEVLARPLLPSGASTYHGLLFVRRDSGITAIEQMQGKRLALVDRATTAGFLLPLTYFTRAGRTFTPFLQEVYFAGTHENAIRDVFTGKADIGAAKNTVFERLVAEEPRIGAELAVLARSPEVPENALALRAGLDDGLRRALRDALLGMAADPDGRVVLQRFGAQRFIETRDDDYEPVYRYAREAGLDLNTYNYRNDE